MNLNLSEMPGYVNSKVHSIFKMLLKISKQYYIFIFYILLIVFLILPQRFASHYAAISRDNILMNTVEQITRNLSVINTGVQCDYEEVIEDNYFMYTNSYTEKILNNNVRLGGEYIPADCNSKYSTAIIVPYRQREKQLNQFLIYMHNYLRRQKIHYRIFLVEQYDPPNVPVTPFNRAKLFNIGALVAMKLEFPCLILHDVDLLPMTMGNLYVCTKQPRHMCSALDKFRYNLPYRGLFGGVVSITSKLYLKINGMSNMFQGWGGEDDDLYGRLVDKNIEICRFDQDYSQYTMLKHKAENPNEERLAYLRYGHLRYNTDGLNSLVYKEVGFKLHNLFTHVIVEV